MSTLPSGHRDVSLRVDAERIRRAAEREDRKARVTLEQLQQGGPPVRIRDLSALTGFSKQKFFDAIDRGELDVKWIRTGQTRMATVERDEAWRYLVGIGFAA